MKTYKEDLRLKLMGEYDLEDTIYVKYKSSGDRCAWTDYYYEAMTLQELLDFINTKYPNYEEYWDGLYWYSDDYGNTLVIEPIDEDEYYES